MHVTKWMNAKVFTLSNGNLPQKTTFESIYTKVQNTQDYSDQKQISQSLGAGKFLKKTSMGHIELFEVMEVFQNWILVIITCLYTFIKTPLTVNFKQINFFVYKLYMIKLYFNET